MLVAVVLVSGAPATMASETESDDIIVSMQVAQPATKVAGQFVNTATASGQTQYVSEELERTRTEATASATVTLKRDVVGRLELLSPSGGVAELGDEVKYAFTLENTSGRALPDIRVRDPLLGLDEEVRAGCQSTAAGQRRSRLS